jgi:16S rRNA (cytosine1402-N4)-methyltransferase
MTDFSPKTRGGHKPVMLPDVLAALQPALGEVYIDGTFGAGGYSRAILEAAACRVIALDKDPDAITGGAELTALYGQRLTLVHRSFSAMRDVVASLGLQKVNGVVLDIGVSSMQIDEAARGFSFMRDGPLDMRMSQGGPSAADHVNSLDQNDLSRVIFILGEEPRARAIARAIVTARIEQPLRTTLELVRAVERATGPQRAKDRTHPATRTFQALRVLVNGELTELAEALCAAEDILHESGRLVVVTFHSLEDRIVKRFFILRAGKEGAPSRHQPERVVLYQPSFTLPRNGAVTAREGELEDNPRSRSAKLRVGVRNVNPAWPPVFNGLALPTIGNGLTA